MESFFSRYRNALVLIAVLVAQLLALAVQARRPAADGVDRPSVSLMRHAVVAIITPPERLVHDTGLWFRSLWFGYIDLIHVRRENAGLEKDLARLRLEQASIAQDAAQGRRLQHMLGFAEHYIYKTLPAQVIGTSGTDQSQVLYIDKGAKDGLQQDMPVITPDGIVGKLKDVFPHTSQVLLVTDPTSGVGVILENTRIRGILKGRAYSQLQVADISPDSRVKAGEPIVTSGGDQIFPRGLPVGTVDRILADPEHDPLVDVLVHPAARLSQLEEVLVITSLSGAVSPQETRDLAESEAEGEAEQKRASDILSERLPSRMDPNAPADTNPPAVADATGKAPPPMVPPRAASPDRFSPNAEPAANQMVPGRRWAPVKEGIEDRKVSSQPKPAQQDAVTGGSPGQAAGGSQTQPGALNPQPQTRVIVDGPETHKAGTPRAAPARTQTQTRPKTQTKTQNRPQLAPGDARPPAPDTLPKTPPAPETQQTTPVPNAQQATPPRGEIR